MAEKKTAKQLDKAIEDLMDEIRREPMPHRMLELAKALQAALDKRNKSAV